MKIDHSELPPLNNQFIDIPQVLFVGGWARDFFRKGVRLIEEGYHPEEIGGKEFGDLLHQKRVEMMREIER